MVISLGVILFLVVCLVRSMAANKFATILHRNSNKITVILVYAFLEWVLIALLLLNSLFGYLISKFAAYFGLKPPCPLCSNVQKLLLQQHEGGSGSRCSFGDQVCEEHADEISRLSYCPNHGRLAETRGLCCYCLTTPGFGDKSVGSARIALVTFGSQKEYMGGDEVSSCSCCGESSKGEHVGPFLLLKPSWNNLAIEELANDDDHIRGEFEELKKPDGSTDHRTETFQEIEDPADEGVADEHQVLSDIESFGIREASEEDCSNSKSVSSSLWYEKEETHMNDKEAGSDCADKISCGSSNQSQILDGGLLKCPLVDGSLDIIDLRSKQDEVPEDLRVIPVEMIDASTNENTKLHILVEEHLRRCHHPDEDFSLKSMIETEISLLEETFIVDESVRKSVYDEIRSLNTDMFRPRRFPVLNSDVGKVQLFDISCPRSETIRGDRSLFPIHEDFVVTTMEDANKLTAFEDRTHIHGAVRDLVHGKSVASVSALTEANTSTEEDGDETEKPLQRFASVKENCQTYGGAESEPEGEEENFSETPTSVDSLDYMHKNSQLDQLESSHGESLEESVKSHMGGGKSAMTIDGLSAALEVERKALHALCAELEEERNASAVAASQTMAMITRLQEEKAAMQMEALQYQRMMEEQSEYDQEALQLLNELMVKREKEKQELEKELEVCRKKVLDYETKERIRVVKKFNAEGSSSLESSASGNAEGEHDEMAADLDHGLRDDECATPTNEVLDLEEMALDCVKHMTSLDDSLSEFEEERLSILDQLRALEEKLLMMSNGEEPHDKGRVNEQYSTCDGRESDEGWDSGVVPDASNDESNSNFLHGYKTTCSPTARRLLPLLDAAENEADGGEVLREHPEPLSSKLELSGSGSIFEEDGQKVAIEEEVDRVYERLQALEADREFLKHCVNSIKQGDKGMSLLQEILQHLRDLKDVELRAKSLNE